MSLTLEKTDTTSTCEFTDKSRPVHFIGCGGAGMFPLAVILAEMGFNVSGSDMADSSQLEVLRSKGAIVSVGHDATNVPDGNAVIVFSSAVSLENPERACAEERGLVSMRRGEALAQILSLYKRPVAISGSHGKTTVTAMLTHILKYAEVDCGFMIGGKLSDGSTPAAAGSGDIFVTEVDESDGTHTLVYPFLGLVTNVEDDHSWSVGGEQQLMENFSNFGNSCNELFYVDSESTSAMYGDLSYSKSLSSGIDDILAEFAGSQCEVWGDYQLINGKLAVEAACRLGLERSDALEALKFFGGVDRRMTLHLMTEKCVIIEDYAHHPTEVKAALSTFKKRFPNHELRVIFQPHRYARLEKYINEFADELQCADKVIVTPVFAAWVETGGVDSIDLVELIGNRALAGSDDWKEIGSAAVEAMNRPTVIAVLGAGTSNLVIPHLKEMVV